MIKSLEVSSPTSCLNKAREDELLFVLLERDPAAPFAIREWVRMRVEIGKNKLDDPEIREALATAALMDESWKKTK